jgi:hypothetical protein
MSWWSIIVTFILATGYQSARINDLRDSKRMDDLRVDLHGDLNNLRAD